MRPGKRLLTLDRFTLPATRNIVYRCLLSQAQWRSLAELCSWQRACLPALACAIRLTSCTE